MDYELEMGYFVSRPVPYGDRMSIKEAKQHIFGMVMLNDWSARSHQIFEMRPLGPFHSKGFVFHQVHHSPASLLSGHFFIPLNICSEQRR